MISYYGIHSSPLCLFFLFTQNSVAHFFALLLWLLMDFVWGNCWFFPDIVFQIISTYQCRRILRSSLWSWRSSTWSTHKQGYPHRKAHISGWRSSPISRGPKNPAKWPPVARPEDVLDSCWMVLHPCSVVGGGPPHPPPFTMVPSH